MTACNMDKGRDDSRRIPDMEGRGMNKAVKWAWTHGFLGAEVFDSLDDAIDSALVDAEAGMESLEFIEHEGEHITFDDARMAQREKERAELEASWRNTGPPVAAVEVRHPSGRWVPVETCYTLDHVGRLSADLVQAVGPERVRARPLDR